MIKNIFAIVALFSVLAAKAQTTDTLRGLAADTLLFYTVEQEPEFPGGMEGFSRYLGKNIRYPAQAFENHKQGKVIVQMVVEKDGSVSHVRVIRSVVSYLDKEAVRVVSSSPKWKPGVQNGQVVRVVYSIPITFKWDPNIHFSGL